MRKCMKITVNSIMVLVLSLSLTACGSVQSYDSYEIPKQEESKLKPVDTLYEEVTYEGIEPTVEKTIATFQSEDGLCTIEQKESYYDVTLDYENGTPAEVGAAYAEAIILAKPDYEAMMEPYLYENIKATFDVEKDIYKVIGERIDALRETLPREYREELEGFAKTFANGEQGFVENGKMSYEEAQLMHMVPDILRGTACSAMSLWGDKSVTGKPVTVRILEWDLGSEYQMCQGHAVVHVKNGEKSFTAITILGLLSILTAVNDDGVFVGELDVGTNTNVDFKGRKSYTYNLRYALEHFDNADDFGAYMVDNSSSYTYSHNLILSDANHCYWVEDCVIPKLGEARICDDTTKLHDGLVWNNPDSFCVVNSFAAAGNVDKLTRQEDNLVRFMKYDKWLGEQEKFSVTDVKEFLVSEKVEGNVVNVYSKAVFHLVLVDYATGTMQATFTGTGGVADVPTFVNIGKY